MFGIPQGRPHGDSDNQAGRGAAFALYGASAAAALFTGAASGRPYLGESAASLYSLSILSVFIRKAPFPFSIPSDFAILSGLPLLRHGIPSLLPIRIRSALPRVSALPPLFPFDAAAPIPARRQYAHSRCTEIFYHRPAAPGEYRLKPYEPRKIPLNGGFPVVFSASVQGGAAPCYTRPQPARDPAYQLLSYGESGWDENPSCPFYGFMV